MALIERDQHDHPDAHPFLPQVGCGIDGRTVQPALELEEGQHWDDLAPDVQHQALEEMAAWSREHAATHTEAEHQDHQRRLDEANR
jgi:hypothetical protein